MPVPGYASWACSRWKITKILSANSGSMPMPLSWHGDLPLVARPGGRRRAPAVARPGRRNFSELPTRLPKQVGQQRLLALARRAGRVQVISPSAYSRAASSLAAHVRHHPVKVDLGEAGGEPADPGERQQVVDQPLHPLRAVDREGDVLVGPLVELAGVAALQQLAEAGHLAQRLLQVVRGHVGELLQVAVGAGQLLGLLLQLAR